jgi:hypothetical protein
MYLPPEMRVFVGVTVFAPEGIRCICRKESKSKPLDKDEPVMASALASALASGDAVFDETTELDDEEEEELATVAAVDVVLLLDFLGLDVAAVVVVVAVFLLRTGKLPESIL